MKLKRNALKRAGRTAIQVVAASGAVEAALQVFTESGDVGVAIKTGAVIALSAVLSWAHGAVDNLLPERRHAAQEE